METAIGVVVKDAVLILADTDCYRSIVKLKAREDKIAQLDSHKVLVAVGETGDREQFCEYIQKNVSLYAIRHNLPLSLHAAANFTRRQLAHALRSNPYNVNLLLGGVDEEGPALYFMDYLASLNKLNFGVHGYASNFLLSVLDKNYKEGLTVEQGLELLKLCIFELKTRFLISYSGFLVKIVDKNGVTTVELKL
eukprot:TRINITY_DN1384_c0_g1_i1.p1 TRINITY_DN1384_c0_g1~~TRINITY_DN1384_c0_g1_i1.p1  ORF type:complete len:227 (-),score=71.37 TRINITY_DN1384_c0_g1_i1:104-685(-)